MVSEHVSLALCDHVIQNGVASVCEGFAHDIKSDFTTQTFRHESKLIGFDRGVCGQLAGFGKGDFVALFAKYRPEFETFEDAMLEVLATSLASPEFLYLTQKVPANHSKSSKTISDVELASRLSIFLWSSIPDEELLTLAQDGKLKNPDVLTGQVKRMLADSRSRRFSRHFV